MRRGRGAKRCTKCQHIACHAASCALSPSCIASTRKMAVVRSTFANVPSNTMMGNRRFVGFETLHHKNMSREISNVCSASMLMASKVLQRSKRQNRCSNVSMRKMGHAKPIVILSCAQASNMNIVPGQYSHISAFMSTT